MCEVKAPGEIPRRERVATRARSKRGRQLRPREGTHWEAPARGDVPVGMEVAQGEDHVAAHGADDGPLAAKPLDEDGWEEHGGQKNRGVECAERRHPQALLTVEAALWRKDEASEEGTVEGTGWGEETRYG